MESPLDYDTWIGRAAYDCNGDKLGEIKDIFYDDATGRPEWAEVKAGLFKGTRIVPLHGARIEEKHADNDPDGRLIVNYSSDMVNDAPAMDTDDDRLSPQQEQELYSYYGFDWSDRNDQDFGYNKYWDKQRFGVMHETPPRRETRTEERTSEHTEEVPVQAQVSVPIDTTVRLRRYETQKQGMRTVQIPTTETEEHVEVEDVSARGRMGQTAGREQHQ